MNIQRFFESDTMVATITEDRRGGANDLCVGGVGYGYGNYLSPHTNQMVSTGCVVCENACTRCKSGQQKMLYMSYPLRLASRH